MLRSINAPLKLLIPGNHDFNLESGYWRRTRAQINSHPAQQQHRDGDGYSDEVDDADLRASWELLRSAAQRDSIFLLPQGTHTFVLPADKGSGTRLRIFASPPTPRGGNWGFQYDRSNPRKWAIPSMIKPSGDCAVDVVMTHGPPKGIRDGTGIGRRRGAGSGAGCAALLAAIEQARPRVHCFGHIHMGWGAEIVTWKRGMDSSGSFQGPSTPTFGNLIDTQRSRVLASLEIASKTTCTTDSLEYGFSAKLPTRATEQHGTPPREEEGCCAVNISPDGEHSVEQGKQTLFVNAAMELDYWSTPRPWRIDMDLPEAAEDDAAAVVETNRRLGL